MVNFSPFHSLLTISIYAAYLRQGYSIRSSQKEIDAVEFELMTVLAEALSDTDTTFSSVAKTKRLKAMPGSFSIYL
jgi:hypothetical protein